MTEDLLPKLFQFALRVMLAAEEKHIAVAFTVVARGAYPIMRNYV